MSQSAAAPSRVERVPLRLILPNPLQPRQIFDENELKEMALSISDHGILHMPVVRPGAIADTGERGYYLIAGERRTRGAELAGYYEIDVVVRDVTPVQAGVLAAVENIQRVNLSPLEDADNILSLMAASEEAGEPLSLAALARKLGKGRGEEWILNRVNLRGMGDDVQDMVATRHDAVVHARAIDGVSTDVFRALLIDFTLADGPYQPLREFTRYIQEAGRGATEEGLRDLIEFYHDKRSMLKKNLRALVERVDRAIVRDRPAKAANAPDAQTSQRQNLNAQTGGGQMSRGRLLTSSTPAQIRAELTTQLENARASLVSAGHWNAELKTTPTGAKALMVEIRTLLDRLETGETFDGE